MSDLRTLLAGAAPAPRTPLDVRAIVAAADGVRRRRRLTAWLAGALAVGAVGVPGTLAVTSSGGARTRVTIDGRKGGTVPPTTTPVAAVTTPPPTVPRQQADGANRDPAPPVRPGSEATASTTPAPGPVTSTTAAGNPEEGCEVTGRSQANVGTGNGGLGVSEFPQCSYTATLDGGYVAVGRWELRIERSGQSLQLSSTTNAPCASGVVHAGDVVTATLRANTNDPADWYIRVGPKHRCR